jgi:hypothetical protein
MFPPARLSLEEAASNFVGYARGPNASMLGRFVVPADCVEPLRRLIAGNPEARGLAVSLSVLLGPDPFADAAFLGADKARASRDSGVRIDAVEFRPASPAMVGELARVLPQGLAVFCEIPYTEDLTAWLPLILEAHWSAKMRTGGITPDSFPSSSAVAEFLIQCRTHGVAFKATAGLHHPVRSRHPLTYEANSAGHVMHGFLNVFLGAALLERGISPDQLRAVLEDTEAANFRFSGDLGHWGRLSVHSSDIARTREHFAI